MKSLSISQTPRASFESACTSLPFRMPLILQDAPLPAITRFFLTRHAKEKMPIALIGTIQEESPLRCWKAWDLTWHDTLLWLAFLSVRLVTVFSARSRGDEADQGSKEGLWILPSLIIWMYKIMRIGKSMSRIMKTLKKNLAQMTPRIS